MHSSNHKQTTCNMIKALFFCGLLSMVAAEDISVRVHESHAVEQIRNYISSHMDLIGPVANAVAGIFDGNAQILFNEQFDGIILHTAYQCTDIYGNWKKYENVIKQNGFAMDLIRRFIADADNLAKETDVTVTVGCGGYQKELTWEQISEYLNSA